MQNKVVSFVLLLACSLSVSPVLAQEPLGLEEIEKGWKTKTIDNVVNGSFGILLERFDQTWPTWMVGEVRDAMEKGLSKVVLEEETDLTVTVDSRNGFVSVSDGGTDGEYMSACYWNRSNGHKLLAVLLGKPTDPCIEVLCTYDYDPAKKCLTPEPAILKGYRWGDKKDYTQLFCKLPKQGKNVVVEEWGEYGPLKHTFTWDGMKPVYSTTESLAYDGGFADIVVKFKGRQPNIKDFVSARFSDDEDFGECLSDIASSWSLYLQGKPLVDGYSFIVDTANAFMCFDRKYTEQDRKQMEMCYWNCSDGIHKLVAENIEAYDKGRQVETECTGWQFFMYDVRTHRMKPVGGDELGFVIDFPQGNDHTVSIALPRQGKTAAITCHTPSGKITKRLTWNGSKFVKEGMISNQEDVMDISEMPKKAERKDSHLQYALYVNVERPASDEGAMDAIYSVWLADERIGTVQKVCQTNPTAAPLWEKMQDKDPDAIDTDLQQIASAERAWIAPGDVSKVIVEGCPDGRNYWTYIIDTDAHTVKQLPSTEGVQNLDWEKKEMTVASYGYDGEGRYSFQRVYSIDGRFLRRTGEIERE